MRTTNVATVWQRIRKKKNITLEFGGLSKLAVKPLGGSAAGPSRIACIPAPDVSDIVPKKGTQPTIDEIE